MQEENKMGLLPIKKLVWTMGLPMIVSMLLQAIYNVVDTAFVINMGEGGYEANIALGYSFPVQILMIAVGVGLGIGVNALISKNLGEGNKKAASKAAWNGVTIALIFYVIFLLFGLFGVEPFIRMQATPAISDVVRRETVIAMGSDYLRICCVFSFGQMLFAIFERFLQSTGRTSLSMVGQIAGALTNILLDYVFIYPLNMGVAGAAYATVIGQFVSFVLDAVFHYVFDKELENKPQNLLLSKDIVKGIFVIGIPATIMQALLSIMMLGSNMVLGTSGENAELLQGSFAIYYKIQQMALFACFGMSNALISLTSYNFGKGSKERVNQIIRYGIIDSLIVSVCIIVFFEIFAELISKLFGLAGGASTEEVTNVCAIAIRIASIGFVFMAFSVSVQGILQGIRSVISPVIISLLRLLVFVIPLELLFLHLGNQTTLLWIAFPVTEILTSVVSFFFLKKAKEKKIDTLS